MLGGVKTSQLHARSRRFAQQFADAGVAGRRQARAFAKALVAVPPEERVDMIVEKLVSELATVLGVSATTIDVDAPMTELGMDSLTAVEFGARAEKELNIKISPFEYSRGISVRGLAAKLVWRLVQQAGAKGAAA